MQLELVILNLMKSKLAKCPQTNQDRYHFPRAHETLNIPCGFSSVHLPILQMSALIFRQSTLHMTIQPVTVGPVVIQSPKQGPIVPLSRAHEHSLYYPRRRCQWYFSLNVICLSQRILCDQKLGPQSDIFGRQWNSEEVGPIENS